MRIIFLEKLEFTPCKAEQPLPGMELKKKEAQKRLQDFKPFLIRFSTRAEEDILYEKSCQEDNSKWKLH